MKLEDEIAKIVKSEDGMRKIAKIIRGQQNEVVQLNATLKAIEEILDGKETSDFMLSFPVVRKVNDLISHNKENAYYAGLVG